MKWCTILKSELVAYERCTTVSDKSISSEFDNVGKTNAHLVVLLTQRIFVFFASYVTLRINAGGLLKYINERISYVEISVSSYALK